MGADVYRIELTGSEVYYIALLMHWTIRYQKMDVSDAKYISEAYAKIVNLMRNEGPVSKVFQMFCYEDGIKAWYDGKTPYWFFEEHPDLLTPVPEVCTGDQEKQME